MGYDKSIYIEAYSIMQQRRNTAIKNADISKAEFYKKYPQAEQLNKELASTLSLALIHI